MGQRSLSFSSITYLQWIIEGALHSLLAFIVSYWAYRDAILHDNGLNNDLWSFSVTVFTAIIIIVTMKLVLYSRMFNWFNVTCFIVFSLGPYFLYVWVTNFTEFSNTHLSIVVTFNSPQFYFVCVLCVCSAFVVDLARRAVEFNIFPGPADFLQRVYKQRWEKGPTDEEREKFWQIRRELEARFVEEDARYDEKREELRRQLREEKRRKDENRQAT